MSSYDDIIHLSRPESGYAKMRRQDRAKLFMPFDALNGFGGAIREKDRVFVPRISAMNDTEQKIDRRLQAVSRGDMVTVVYFVPVQRTLDEVLGEYLTVTDIVIRVDSIEKKLLLGSAAIPFEDIANLTSENLAKMEDTYEL